MKKKLFLKNQLREKLSGQESFAFKRKTVCARFLTVWPNYYLHICTRYLHTCRYFLQKCITSVYAQSTFLHFLRLWTTYISALPTYLHNLHICTNLNSICLFCMKPNLNGSWFNIQTGTQWHHVTLRFQKMYLILTGGSKETGLTTRCVYLWCSIFQTKAWKARS